MTTTMRSLRVKIALLSALVSGLVLGAFGASALGWLYSLGLRGIDADIAEQAGHLGTPIEPGRWQRLEGALHVLYGAEAEGAPILLVTDRSGQTLHISPHWPADLRPEDLPQPDYASLGRHPPPPPPDDRLGPPPEGPRGPPRLTRPVFVTRESTDVRWRLGIVANDRAALAIGIDLGGFASHMRRNQRALLLSLPVALVLIALGAWIVAGRALRPVEAIADAAERVTAAGLDQRVPEANQDVELQRLVTVLNEMLDRLEASFHQATRFSAGAAHELKTPLTILQGELETALQDAPSGSNQQRVYSGLLEEAQRLKGIVRKLLLLSLADSGELHPDLDRVSLTEAADDMCEDARALAPHLRVTDELQGDVWVMADAGLLRQVLSNLGSNAIKHNREDGSIDIRLEADESTAWLSVSNTGEGIPAEDRDKVFDRFHRVDRSRGRRVDGVGLGLSLAREIVRAHAGELVLEEADEDKTTFRMTLPRAGRDSAG